MEPTTTVKKTNQQPQLRKQQTQKGIQRGDVTNAYTKSREFKF